MSGVAGLISPASGQYSNAQERKNEKSQHPHVKDFKHEKRFKIRPKLGLSLPQMLP
jgi:hypothetical protein